MIARLPHAQALIAQDNLDPATRRYVEFLSLWASVKTQSQFVSPLCEFLEDHKEEKEAAYLILEKCITQFYQRYQEQLSQPASSAEDAVSSSAFFQPSSRATDDPWKQRVETVSAAQSQDPDALELARSLIQDIQLYADQHSLSLTAVALTQAKTWAKGEAAEYAQYNPKSLRRHMSPPAGQLYRR